MDLPAPHSLWMDTAPSPDRTKAQLPSSADVVVVGAGVAGLTAAHQLAAAGRQVLVLEAGRVAAGVSGHTTAKVSAQHGLRYDRLRRRKGEAASAEYAAAQVEALEWIEEQVAAHGVDCSWERRHSYLYTQREEDRDQYRAEAQACVAAGLRATMVDETPLPFPVAAAVRVDDQAQFHPRRWLLHLARQIHAAGGQVAEGVRVTGLDRHLTVVTADGEVTAKDVVVATHYPILDRGGFFARLAPVRDLVVSGPVDPGRAPEGMFLCTSTSRSVRTVPRDGGGLRLLVGGENYRTGAAGDIERRYATLAGFAAQHFGVDEVTHRWSAHDLETPDGVPYAGRYHPGASHLWVAAGFNLWGMTGGTAAGRLVADLVLGRADEERAALFDPARVGVDQVPRLLKDNATVGRYLIGDLAKAAMSGPDLESLTPGQARVGRVGRRVVAAYRDPDGGLHAVDGRCTHLGCVLAFNDAETSWDCPCHGSRFSVDGEVLHGPAVDPLRPAD